MRRLGLMICSLTASLSAQRDFPPDIILPEVLRSSQDIHLQAGESRWIYGDTRSEKNLSPQPLEMLLIEPK